MTSYYVFVRQGVRSFKKRHMELYYVIHLKSASECLPSNTQMSTFPIAQDLKLLPPLELSPYSSPLLFPLIPPPTLFPCSSL